MSPGAVHRCTILLVFVVSLGFVVVLSGRGDVLGARKNWEELKAKEEMMEQIKEVQKVQAETHPPPTVVPDLLAGRLTLLEAAARFRDGCVRQPEVTRHGWRLAYGHLPEAEGYCEMVIRHVQSKYELDERPAEGQAAARRLRAEMEQHRRDGTLRLP